MIYKVNHTLPFGAVHIESDGTSITSLTYGTGETTETCRLIEVCIMQLEEYAAGSRREFHLPLAPRGTAFQAAVWQALLRIPYGETRSYGEIAAAIGRPKAARAVGSACNQNPILLLIPCHRVIGADRSLTGFGAGIELKQTLLTLEMQYK